MMISPANSQVKIKKAKNKDFKAELINKARAFEKSESVFKLMITV